MFTVPKQHDSTPGLHCSRDWVGLLPFREPPKVSSCFFFFVPLIPERNISTFYPDDIAWLSVFQAKQIKRTRRKVRTHCSVCRILFNPYSLKKLYRIGSGSGDSEQFGVQLYFLHLPFPYCIISIAYAIFYSTYIVL